MSIDTFCSICEQADYMAIFMDVWVVKGDGTFWTLSHIYEVTHNFRNISKNSLSAISGSNVSDPQPLSLQRVQNHKYQHVILNSHNFMYIINTYLLYLAIWSRKYIYFCDVTLNCLFPICFNALTHHGYSWGTPCITKKHVTAFKMLCTREHLLING